MKQHIYGTTTPITPLEANGPNAFAVTSECIELMKNAGIMLTRTIFPFPFSDETMTTVTADYAQALECVRLYRENGIETMAAIPTAEQSTVDDKGLVSYVRKYPQWMGDYNGDFYYEVLEKMAERIAQDLGESVQYWQIGNENDMDAFKGSLTHEQNVRYLRSLARGVKKVNPNAVCGINLAGVPGIGERKPEGENLSGVHPYAEELINALYHDGSGLFDYIGLDGYFGTWADGGPESWIPYIDRAYEVAGKPVMINEWGYSTLQRGKPRPVEDQNRRFNSDVCRYKDWDKNGTVKWQGKDHSEETQAEYITECLKIFRDHPHCIGNLFFQWQDMATCWQCGDDDCPAETAWGCIDKNGRPKPGYYALQKFIQANA